MNTDNDAFPSTGAGWVLRVRSGDMTPNDRRRLTEWRSNLRNNLDYLRADLVWQECGKLADDPKIRAELDALRRAAHSRARLRAWSRGSFALAASVVAAALAGVLWVAYGGTEWERTDVGEQRVVSLPDGSRIDLNTDSRVRVRFTEEARQLSLARGEALFDVAHDARRPFVVRVPHGEVRAIGTRFNVIVQDDIATVTMLEGSVEVAGFDQRAPIRLNAGSDPSIAISSDGSLLPADPTAASVRRIEAWQQKMLIFINQPAATTIRDHNRYSLMPVVLENDAKGEIPVTGRVPIGDSLKFAHQVAGAIGAEVVVEEHRIVLR